MVFNVGVDLHKTQFTYCCIGPEMMFGKCLTTPEGYEQFLEKMKRISTDGGKSAVGRGINRQYPVLQEADDRSRIYGDSDQPAEVPAGTGTD